MTSRHRLLLAVGLAALFADQGTKYLAASRLASGLEGRGLARAGAFFAARHLRAGQEIAAGPAVALRYVENPGAAWNLGASVPEAVRRPLLLFLGALALGFLAFMFSRLSPRQRALQAGLLLMIGGALGNMLDRALRGYVIDFLEVHWGRLSWPTFNLADLAISAGLALMLRGSLGVQASDHPAGGALSAGLPNS